jgi:hypothetical protein
MARPALEAHRRAPTLHSNGEPRGATEGGCGTPGGMMPSIAKALLSGLFRAHPGLRMRIPSCRANRRRRRPRGEHHDRTGQ